MPQAITTGYRALVDAANSEVETPAHGGGNQARRS